jgi:hypothetical protein
MHLLRIPQIVSNSEQTPYCDFSKLAAEELRVALAMSALPLPMPANPFALWN